MWILGYNSHNFEFNLFQFNLLQFNLFQFKFAMNSNFGSSSDSNWGSSSNSKLEAKWAQMRQEDEESDEEVQVKRNKQNIAAAMAAAMVC